MSELPEASSFRLNQVLFCTHWPFNEIPCLPSHWTSLWAWLEVVWARAGLCCIIAFPDRLLVLYVYNIYTYIIRSYITFLEIPLLFLQWIAAQPSNSGWLNTRSCNATTCPELWSTLLHDFVKNLSDIYSDNAQQYETFIRLNIHDTDFGVWTIKYKICAKDPITVVLGHRGRNPVSEYEISPCEW